MHIMSTPSATAWSIAAIKSEATFPSSKLNLYTASLARGATPFAVPGAYPKYDAPLTKLPAAIEATWVP